MAERAEHTDCAEILDRPQVDPEKYGGELCRPVQILPVSATVSRILNLAALGKCGPIEDEIDHIVRAAE